LGWRRRVLWALVALGLVAGLPDLVSRVRAEAADRYVEIVADQADFLALARAEHKDPVRVFAALRGAGVGAVGVTEDTLASLSAAGRVTVFSGSQWAVVRCASGSTVSLPQPNPQGTYVWTTSAPLATWLTTALRQALGASAAVRQLALGPRAGYLVSLPSVPMARALSIPLGFAPSAFAVARASGLHVVPEPVAPPAGMGTRATDALWARIARARVPVDAIMLPEGVPGYPASLAATARTFRAERWPLAVIETPIQLGNLDPAGTRALSQALLSDTVRVFEVPAWELDEFAARPDPRGTAVAGVISAVAERNLRLVYLTPVGGAHPLGNTLTFCKAVVQQLEARGFVFAPPHPFPLLRVSTTQRVLQAVGTAAAGLLLLEFLVPGLAGYGFQPLAVAGGLACLLALGSHTLATEVVALGAACVSGGLATAYATGLWRWGAATPPPATFRQVWLRGVRTALGMGAITLAGALVIGTIMGDTEHLLEWQYYRGVKLTYVGIPALALWAFWRAVGVGRWPGWPELRARLAGWAASPWRRKAASLLRWALVALLVAAVLAVYLLRSGNVSQGSVLALEVHLREVLARLLRYRPREKEFVVGYPSVFLAAFFAARQRRWGFLAFFLGASVAPVSVVDTFAHLRTPFLFSLWRESVGLGVGLLTATAALGVFWGAERIWLGRRAPDPAVAAAAGAPARRSGPSVRHAGDA
jgi:hypothetical protein